MTTATAGNVEKEKVEKRRALGRGLESLLPGPRVVVSPAVAQPAKDAAPAAASAAERGPQRPAGVPGVGDRKSEIEGYRVEGGVPAEAAELRSAGQPAAVPTAAIATADVDGDASSSLRSESAGRTNASAPTQTLPPTALPASLSSETVSAADVERDESGEPVRIFAMAEGGRRLAGNLVLNLALELIHKNPFQTRHVEDDEALEELAESIKAQGVVQPIVVRPSEEDDGHYVLILGERRLHASKKAGKTHIPALVRTVSDQQAAEMTIIENLQREDLSPLEQAEAFRVLSTNFAMTQAQIAERVGLSRESVTNYMRLLKLPRTVMEMLAEKRINFAQAKELLKLGDNDRIAEAALYAVKKGMNIEQVESLVLRMDGLLDPLPDMPGVKKRTGGARWVDPNVRAAQMDLERLLGMRVRIRDRKGKGKIVIEYSTVDDYERVVEMLRGKK